VIVVANGGSLADISPALIFGPLRDKYGPVIAVNGAIRYLTTADMWFTCNRSFANLRIMLRPDHGCEYYAATNKQLPDHVTRLIPVVGGRKAGVKPPRKYHRTDYQMWHQSARKGLSLVPGYIHAGNSAWGALQLAVHKGAKEILLIGVDGTSDERATGGYSKDLRHLPKLFASAVPDLDALGVRVINCSPASAVDCFEKRSVKEML